MLGETLGVIHEAVGVRRQAPSVRVMSLLTDSRNPETTTSSRRTPHPWRELASRRTGGITVGLYWQPDGDEVFVEVTDQQTGETFVLEPPKSAALSAFYHPYAIWSRDGDDE
jgi:hypothetical protein